ncbi:hypothetical protein V1515DRAFT_136945 [Lipomyces mesembrius]
MYSSISRNNNSLLLCIPKDILSLILYYLDYFDIAKILRSCKYLNKICDTESFWFEYYKIKKIHEQTLGVTMKANVQYHFMYFKSYTGPTRLRIRLFDNIKWDVRTNPLKTAEYLEEYYKIADDGFLEEYDAEAKAIEYLITNREWCKIAWLGEINISIPNLHKLGENETRRSMLAINSFGKFKKNDRITFNKPDTAETSYQTVDTKTTIITPDTIHGITLRHLLCSIYKEIWCICNREINLRDIIDNPHIEEFSFQFLSDYLRDPYEDPLGLCLSSYSL